MTTPAEKISTPAELNRAILDFLLNQRKEGRADETIRSRIQSLNQVARTCNLLNPENVKYLANSKWNNKTKTKFCDTYSAFARHQHITWIPPKYQITEKLPFIPTEQEIDLLISGTGTVTSTVLQMLKETGMRIGELVLLAPKDIDTKRKTVNITPIKGSNPRILPISDKLIGMLNALPKTHETVFQPDKRYLREYLDTQRKALAQKLNNPRLKLISFHTLRHWKGTMEYHNTKDIMHVKAVLGHKSITSTMIYINLENALYLETNDNFTCKIAHYPQEETQLIEAGFTFVNNRGELAFYKKRK